MTRPNRQEIIYQYIEEQYAKNGYSPSISEIAAHAGLSAKSYVHRVLQQLVFEGRLTNLGGRYVPSHLQTDNSARVAVVPVVGKVAAGVPISAFEDLEGYVAYLPRFGDKEELFALRIKGDSMINAEIFDKDIVIVEKTNEIIEGDIVVALIGDEATVKTFYKESGHIRLQPENPDYQPIIVDDVIILGKVVASMRYLDNRGKLSV
jgi:repressor LexA